MLEEILKKWRKEHKIKVREIEKELNVSEKYLYKLDKILLDKTSIKYLRYMHSKGLDINVLFNKLNKKSGL